MQRRKFLIGMGSLAAGGAAATGTGAFSTEAAGSVKIDVVGPASAYLGVDPETSSEYVSDSNGVEIDLAEDRSGGSGIAENSDFIINPAFYLMNNTSEALYIEIDNPLSNNDMSTSSAEGPSGLDVQFLTAPSLPLRDYNEEGIGLIGRNSAVDDSNGLGGGFDDPGSNEYWFHQGSKDTVGGRRDSSPNRTSLKSDSQSAAGALKISSGEDYPVVFRVATKEPGTSVELNVPIRIEAYDSKSNLTYDNIVNNEVSGTW